MVKIYSQKISLALLTFVLFTLAFSSGCKKSAAENITTSDQYIKYTINNISYSYNIPADTLYTGANFSLSAIAIFGENVVTPVNNVAMLMNYTGMGVGSNQKLLDFSPCQVNGHLSITNPIFVKITEFGPAGQVFISGEFTGIFTGPPANTQYNVTCSFRVKR